MRAGEFADGAHVLRAKIDMASPNLNMRDPTLYRIRTRTHHRTGDAWCIYPMYDYAHPLSDAIERITHSLCTLEFEDHRPLYDWLVEQLVGPDQPDRPQQIEFARLNLNYTVMSKRKLLQLVQQGHVSGWDDPRMPTITGLRRRGYTPESIRDFCARIGVAKKENVIDVAQLEHSVREDLNRRAPRVMTVLRPLKVVITNYPEGQVEDVDVINNPEDPNLPARGRCHSRASSTSSATTSGRIRRRSSSDSRPDAKCGCAARTSSRAPRSSRTITARSWSCAARTIPRRAAAMRPTGGASKPRCTGSPPPTRSRVEVRLYDRLFTVEDPERTSDGRDVPGPPEPGFARSAASAAGRSRAWRRRPHRSAFSSSGSAISAWIPTPGPARSCSTGLCRCATRGRGLNERQR